MDREPSHDSPQPPASATATMVAPCQPAGQAAWNHGQSLLLIMETDLSSRYAYVERVLCRDKHVLPLKNVTKKHLLNTLTVRLRLRGEISSAYQELKQVLSGHRFVFLSNTEGFIARNIVRWIRRDFPAITLFSMQHGIVILERNRIKMAVTFCLNRWTEFAADYSLLGEGLVNDCIDYYIVYNQSYKSVLVADGISAGRVIISSLFLKGDKFIESGNTSAGVQKNNALFLLQCLSALAITDRETEAALIHSVVAWLSKQYDVVFLKQHPYCNIELASLPNNCTVVEGEVADIARECAVAISFFSVALLECEYLGLRTIAIRSRSLNVTPEAYSLFELIGDLQDDGSVVLSASARAFSKYYESQIASPDELSEYVTARAARH